MNGKFVLIARKSPMGTVLASGEAMTLVNEPTQRILSGKEAIGSVRHQSKVLGLVLCEDFPPALGAMERGESVLVASARDESRYLFLLKVADGV